MPPRYRADHIGSLMRPQTLIEARAPARKAFLEGTTITNDDREKVQVIVKNSIRDVVRDQLDRNINPLTSGEFERALFFDGFFESLGGFETRMLPWEDWRPELPNNAPLQSWGMTGREASIATSKLQRAKPAYLEDWLLLRSCLPEGRWKDAKMTMPSPTWWHIQVNHPYTEDSGYSSDAEYLQDIAAAMREEMLELYSQGLRNVQIDDPNLSFFCSQEWLDALHKEGIDEKPWLDIYIRAFNAVLRDLPEDLQVGLHICRGNYPGGVGVVSGGYENLAARLFNETQFKLFYLEFDSPRSGDFGPLKHLPMDKVVVLGVMSTKKKDMEDPEELRGRVMAAAEVIAKANTISQREALNECIAISPQCGFSSDHSGGGVGMTIEVQWEKLQLLQKLAGSLWPGWKP